MPNTPITLAQASGPPFSVVSGRLLHFVNGAWLLDLELSANDVSTFGVPSGRVVVTFGGTPMTGTIDPTASGSFGPTARVRVVGGGGGWAKPVQAQQWHADNGVLSTTVYQSTGALVGETVVDEAPTLFNGADFVRAGDPPTKLPTTPSLELPASAVFRDNPWWVDVAGVTHVGPRPPSVADPSVVIRDWDPVLGRVTFTSQALLLPGTRLLDPRFNGAVPVVGDVEQLFDGEGGMGWAWTGPGPLGQLAGDLKAATLYWTRAGFLRVYRYRLVLYQGPGPAGGPSRAALQAVTPSAGIPDLLPITPWSGVAGVVSELAPSQEVLVVFENADPTLPRIFAYSLVSGAGQPLGLPLKTTIDASVELDIGVECPIVNVGKAAQVNLAGGAFFLVPAPWAEALTVALATFGGACSTSTTDPILKAAALALVSALGLLPPDATLLTKGT